MEDGKDIVSLAFRTSILLLMCVVLVKKYSFSFAFGKFTNIIEYYGYSYYGKPP